jgi:hypothetical protein
MELDAQHVEVWEANIVDQPGGLAHVLDALEDAGIGIESFLALRSAPDSGRGRVVVTPFSGEHEVAVAAHTGFHIPEDIHTVRISGRNRAGRVAGLPGMIARLGISLRGFTASIVGAEFVAYVATDSESDADRVVHAMRQL